MQKIFFLVISLFTLSFSLMAEFRHSLEIVQNDGEVLRLRVGKLHLSQSEYFLTVKFNGFPHSMQNVREGEELRFDIDKTGLFTFIFYRLQGMDNLLTKFWSIWEQDVFVIADADFTLSSEAIDQIASRYAPVTLFDDREQYYPVTLGYLFNQEETDPLLAEEYYKLKIKKEIRHYIPIDGARNRDINFKFKDIAEVLPYNGDRIGVIDITSEQRHNTRQKLRYGSEKSTAVYYSSFQRDHLLYINYHYFYSYDPKNKEDSAGAHVFDRESITLIYDVDQEKPTSIIYGAHLENQKMGIVDDLKNAFQKWSGGRVWLDYDEVFKVGEHPLAVAALGSHGMYPIVGTYQVYLKDRIATLTEPAGGNKVIVPPGVKISDRYKKVHGLDVRPYRLINLQMGDITSSSWNRILSFSGHFVDILDVPFVTQNAGFPPYTEREKNIFDYADLRNAVRFELDKTPEKVLEKSRMIIRALQQEQE